MPTPTPRHGANPSLPAGIEFDIEYHLLANRALSHLLNRISEETGLSASDRLTSEFLAHYMKAWKAPDDDPCLAMEIRLCLSILGSALDSDQAKTIPLDLIDTLVPLMRRRRRELRAMSRELIRPAPDLDPEEPQ